MKTLLIDLDGVLNTYRGNYDANYIPPMREGTKEFLENLTKNDCEIKIFTTRDKKLAEQWLKDNDIYRYTLGVTNVKEPCYLMIDDRCITFEGDFQNTIKSINEFKVWYK